jgi:Mrp family chromosome partitioning ATPase
MQPVSKHIPMSSRLGPGEPRPGEQTPDEAPAAARYVRAAEPFRPSAPSDGSSMAIPSREVILDPHRLDRALGVLSNGDPRLVEQFEGIAISLVLAAQQQRVKRILVASPSSGDGRTTAVLNLAGALAAAKQRVLVVDCDFRNPSVLRSLGTDAEYGLVEAVTTDLPLMAVLLAVHPARFHVLPTRKPVDNAAGVLVTPAFQEMLATLDQLYDFILFDAPPLADPRSHLVVGLVDTTVLVIRAGRTTSAQLARAIEPLKEENLFGVVLNRASL